MPDDNNMMTTLHQQHTEFSNKYTYFLLAAAASATAFAVQQTETAILSWSLLPMALAISAWSFSFYCGCKNLEYVKTAIFANFNILSLQAGLHPQQPPHPELLKAALRGAFKALSTNINKAGGYAVWQFRFLLVGAGFFLFWHIVGIVLRTYAPCVT
jgi:hypothetical protein